MSFLPEKREDSGCATAIPDVLPKKCNHLRPRGTILKRSDDMRRNGFMPIGSRGGFLTHFRTLFTTGPIGDLSAGAVYLSAGDLVGRLQSIAMR